jgi:hypothetical protein
MIKWFLSLILFMCCITFIDLCMLNHLCILQLDHGISLFTCCWIHLTSILLRIFVTVFIKEIVR